MKTISLAAVCAALLLAAGCRKLGISGYKPIGPDCPAQQLPSGAVMKTIVAGGIAGTYESLTYFEDGRVVEALGWPGAGSQKETTFRIPPERLIKLDADLTAAGLFGVKEGCWERGSAIADGMSSQLVVRHGGKTHSYSGSGEVPQAVLRGEEIARALARDVDRSKSNGSENESESENENANANATDAGARVER